MCPVPQNPHDLSKQNVIFTSTVRNLSYCFYNLLWHLCPHSRLNLAPAVFTIFSAESQFPACLLLSPYSNRPKSNTFYSHLNEYVCRLWSPVCIGFTRHSWARSGMGWNLSNKPWTGLIYTMEFFVFNVWGRETRLCGFMRRLLTI